MSKPGSRAEAALGELCVRYGYCISAEQAEAILGDLPDDPDSVLDAVLIAEGHPDPNSMDKHDRERLREVVCDWLFDNGHGRGTKSGLPRLPGG